ncbi:MAG: L-aspartate oxidase [Bryobacteraceae bacterium]|nr:L-aspartate oxidase [Bryobacteraceae bacterium]
MGIDRLAETIRTDFLVIGAGVAGMRAAIELARAGSVLVVAKDSLQESSSEYAQGGIAVALSDEDDISLHEADTLAAGDGLCNPAAVRVLVSEGPARIEELIRWGAEFDREGAKLLFAREGAHSRSRVLHSHGDSTGREIARTLYRAAAALPNVRFEGFTAVVDLLLEEGRVAGALILDARRGLLVPVLARATLLATGGLGRVYADTTNPDVATGDGISMAWRAGAVISDIEFVQFHPTALHIEGAPRFLLSEALRGEGARLLNVRGERFMPRYHPMAELAPRDVVSRAIVSEMRHTGAPHVLLDISGRGDFVRKRFPRIHATCLAYGIDLDREPAPVCPAAHYAMGGVWSDLDGRTTLEGLWAAGEAACTGVHGANRLASNSLLEGVVYGARAGAHMREAAPPVAPARFAPPAPLAVPSLRLEEMRRLAMDRLGIVRCSDSIAAALETLEQSPCEAAVPADRDALERANTRIVLSLIARCALARRESRGAHYRTDYPEKSDAFRAHSRIARGKEEAEFAPVEAG